MQSLPQMPTGHVGVSTASLRKGRQPLRSPEPRDRRLVPFQREPPHENLAPSNCRIPDTRLGAGVHRGAPRPDSRRAESRDCVRSMGTGDRGRRRRREYRGSCGTHLRAHGTWHACRCGLAFWRAKGRQAAVNWNSSYSSSRGRILRPCPLTSQISSLAVTPAGFGPLGSRNISSSSELPGLLNVAGAVARLINCIVCVIR